MIKREVSASQAKEMKGTAIENAELAQEYLESGL